MRIMTKKQERLIQKALSALTRLGGNIILAQNALRAGSWGGAVQYVKRRK